MPVYQGEVLLDQTLTELLAMQQQLPEGWQLEIIAVDDGSTDGSYARLAAFQQQQPQVLRIFRLARNCGSMVALRAGLSKTRGEAVVFAAQDLQESPEVLLMLFNSWLEHGDRLHIAHRGSRQEALKKMVVAEIYHWLFRKFIMRHYPARGIATFLIDRKVADELIAHMQPHADLGTQAVSLGYSYRAYPVHRSPSRLGKSLWTLPKNIKLAIDNFIAFSYLPVRMMSAIGMVMALVSFVFSTYVFVGKFTGWYPINQPDGWATIVVLLTFLFGLVMVMLGMIGEYLWRILDYVRNQPMYLIDEEADEVGSGKPPRA